METSVALGHERHEDEHQFDQILDEACLSGLGVSFEQLDKEWEDYREDFLCEWGSSQEGEHELPSDPRVLVMDHPSREEFTLEDAERIAQVSFLGRKLIDTARSGLEQNQKYQENYQIYLAHGEKHPFGAIGAAFETMQANLWHRCHPEVEAESQDLERDPEAASPLRIADWPNGQYLNCLGSAIATAAACEYAGEDYVFINELRESDSYIGEHHRDLMAYFEKLAPGLFSRSEMQRIFATSDRSHTVSVHHADLLFNIPPSLTERDRNSFHHSVAFRFSEVDLWIEADPYALTFNERLIGSDDSKSIHDYLHIPGNQVSTANIDLSSHVREFYRDHASALRSLHEEASRHSLRDMCEVDDGYKSSNLFPEIQTRLQEIALEASKNLPAQDQEVHARIYANWLMTHMIISLYGELTNDTDLEDTVISNHHTIFEQKQGAEGAKDEAWELIDHASMEIHRRIQRDSKVRERLYEYLDVLPYAVVANMYRVALIDLAGYRGRGHTDVTCEYGNPEFMIGAMYLNHYATWRKDGIVNIAKHLVELTPSQLLWQASLQDGESTPRGDEVGRKVANLTPTQLNHIVRIASLANPPTER